MARYQFRIARAIVYAFFFYCGIDLLIAFGADAYEFDAARKERSLQHNSHPSCAHRIWSRRRTGRLSSLLFLSNNSEFILRSVATPIVLESVVSYSGTSFINSTTIICAAKLLRKSYGYAQKACSANRIQRNKIRRFHLFGAIAEIIFQKANTAQFFVQFN